MAAGEVVARGYWCRNCEFFEDPENLAPGGCMGCGCTPDSHDSVELVSTGGA